MTYATPETSLARLIADKQAEALEQLAADSFVFDAVELRDRASELRRQAEGGGIMKDHELDEISNARRDVDAAIRRLRRVPSRLEDNSHAEQERQKISEALDLLIAASDTLYRKEHGH